MIDSTESVTISHMGCNTAVRLSQEATPMTTEKEKRLAQVREAKRTYREKMRAAGLREVTLWVTPEQHEAIRKIAPQNHAKP